MTTVVVGAGLGGLSTALFLARRGRPVTVLERDADPVPDTVDDVASWVRRGTPQAGQSHAFVARCRKLLAEEAPDVLDALRAAGVDEVSLSAAPPPTLTASPEHDPELVVLCSRRTVFEWVLRRVVEREPMVTLRRGAAVKGLLTEPGVAGVPLVTGVALEDGASVTSDFVVDAAGRRSALAGSLQETGAAVPEERVIPCGIAYCTQFFRRRPGSSRPPLNRGYVAGGSFDRYSCLVFPADNGTFSVTFGILPEDRAMRCLHDDDGFLAAARSIPVVADWLDPDHAQPLSGVAAMRGLNNRFRRLVEGDRPAALGIVAVGDAACITNPSHTRGSTLALASGWAAARAIDEHEDAEARAMAVDSELRSSCEPRFWDSVHQDASRLERWRSGHEGPVHAKQDGDERVTNAAASLAAQRDPIVWRAFTRAQQLLELPDRVLADRDVVARTRAVIASGWMPPPLPAPDHDELVAIAEAAASRVALDRTG